MINRLVFDMSGALGEEIDAVQAELARRRIDRPLQAPSGETRSGPASTAPVYRFVLPGGPYDIRPDDYVRIRAAAESDGSGAVLEISGRVASFVRREGLLRVQVADHAGPRLGPSILEFDPTWLLHELGERLMELADEPDRYFPESALRVLGRLPPSVGRAHTPSDLSQQLNEPQRAALERALGSDFLLIWGPPGTGKSHVAARLALACAKEGPALLVATTNGALDELADRVVAVAPDCQLEKGLILRTGARRTRGLDSRVDLRGIVEKRLSGRRMSSDEYRRRAVRLSRKLVAGADIVLATFARVSIGDELRDQQFQTLIIDEASMALLPYVALAASRARHRTVAVGDFQQLAPVVVSDGPEARRWLRTDLFRENGLVEDRGRGEVSLPSENDDLCALLDKQYRMAPGIRRLVSELFYGGRLRDGVVGGSADGPGAALLVDTSTLGGRVERSGGSRQNRRHAEVVLELLLGRTLLADDEEIAVLAPYRAQVKLLREQIRRALGRAAPANLEIATIHRFQGREKGTVIIDTVDAPPTRPWFLDERRNAEFPRLLNVALSRARSKLIVIANARWFSRALTEAGLMNRLLAQLPPEPSTPGRSVIPDLFQG